MTYHVLSQRGAEFMSAAEAVECAVKLQSGEQIWTDRYDRKMVVVQFVHQLLDGMSAMAA